MLSLIISIDYQRLVRHLAMPALLLGILSGCADEIDQAEPANQFTGSRP